RVYKPAMTHEAAAAQIEAGTGTHFDPQVVVAFQAVADRFASVAEENR
ncbi:MAG TPA: two-component system response regulator, partial [Phycisphaerae bacterium]|nr:two-component system response regulator [Phycisphaerae bacterium]